MSSVQRQHENNASSILTKLTPELRRAVDVAIVERCPPTFQGVWMELKLGEHGITYSAFYRYARRLRDKTNLADTLGLIEGQESDVNNLLQHLLSRRLLEILLNTGDAAALKEIASLTSAHRRVTRSLQDTEKSRIAWARLENERDLLRIKLEELLRGQRNSASISGPQSRRAPSEIRGRQSEIGERQSSALPDDPETRKGLQKLLELTARVDDKNPTDRSNPDRADPPKSLAASAP